MAKSTTDQDNRPPCTAAAEPEKYNQVGEIVLKLLLDKQNVNKTNFRKLAPDLWDYFKETSIQNTIKTWKTKHEKAASEEGASFEDNKASTAEEKQEEEEEEVDEEDEEDDDFFEEAQEDFVPTMPTETTADLALVENPGYVTVYTTLDIHHLQEYLVGRVHLLRGDFSKENTANFEVVVNRTRTGCTVTSPVPFASMENFNQDRDFLNHLPQGIQLDYADEAKQYGIYMDTKYPNEEDRHAITYSTPISFGSMKIREPSVLEYLCGKTNQFIFVYAIDKDIRRKTGHSGLKTNKSSHPFSPPPPAQQQQYYQHQHHQYASPQPQQQHHQYASPQPQQQQYNQHQHHQYASPPPAHQHHQYASPPPAHQHQYASPPPAHQHQYYQYQYAANPMPPFSPIYHAPAGAAPPPTNTNNNPGPAVSAPSAPPPPPPVPQQAQATSSQHTAQPPPQQNPVPQSTAPNPNVAYGQASMFPPVPTSANVVPDDHSTTQPPEEEVVGGGGTTRARTDGNMYAHGAKLARSPKTSDTSEASSTNFFSNVLRKAPFG